VFVGKRAGRPAVRQEFINRLLVRTARRGQRVVRLKGGDPFVFGRGGEEALALLAAGVPFDIVPGVSAAIAAPALSGIPVTHRGTSAAFVVVSGHNTEAYAPVLTGLAPGSATVVVLMGLGAAADIGALLLERGWAPETPVAVLYGASTEAADRWTGVLAELHGLARAQGGPPGTIVIGDVVKVGAMIARGMDEAAGDVMDALGRVGAGR
jgi:uroporphyrin-III C-methyltransferase/precorrin-2 dehydrogenase/sirohydrochlorin ferrochelatase